MINALNIVDIRNDIKNSIYMKGTFVMPLDSLFVEDRIEKSAYIQIWYSPLNDYYIGAFCDSVYNPKAEVLILLEKLMINIYKYFQKRLDSPLIL